ncbi:MAG: MFS transporter [Candidatus Diapherotrites archaeon]|uniref:MFS transporter n=1 Tax=Candidatus Iainarchaeum sp. TaxID=3101447 RepID=A0A8T4C6C5_9ARCH|nr:MFS transporter [Candidatus Diapherotrites archaeon]
MNPRARILLVSSNLWYLAEGLFGPLLAVFAGQVGGNILDISFAWAIFLIVSGLANVFIGRLSDKHSREKILVLGYALNTLVLFGYIFVSNPMQLFIAEAFMGLAAAMASPTWYSLFSQYETKKSSGREWGLVTGQAKIATAAAMIVGGYIVTYLSFTALFVLMGSIQLVATLYQAKILRT